MKKDNRWKLVAGFGLLILSLILYGIHYLIFQDAHHIFLYFIGDLAFIPVEVLIVTLIIDQLLESREKQQRMEKLNMVIGTFFSEFGTPLLAVLSHADPGINKIQKDLVIGNVWNDGQFRNVQANLASHTCSISGERFDREDLRKLLVNHEQFILRLLENPMVFEHESFTDLILATSHLTEELKARDDLNRLPLADLAHLNADTVRVYERLAPEWLKYMEYLRNHYPYLFSLAMRKNPFDTSASVVIRE